MCLIAFAIGAHPGVPLLLASNRDEFFERPTEALHRWPEGGGIWAGRDRRDGGTWLGISEHGRVALLTNVRSARAGTGPRSRGDLVAGWLRGQASADALAEQLVPGDYGGFNLVVGDLHSSRWTWLCNRDPAAPHTDAATRLHRQELSPGLYGLSNAVLDTPWTKTLRLKKALAEALPAASLDGAGWTAPLRTALADATPARELPDTGVQPEVEQALSSAFVHMPRRGYGTRSSLLMRVRPGEAGFRADLHEWTHPSTGWSPLHPVHHRVDC